MSQVRVARLGRKARSQGWVARVGRMPGSHAWVANMNLKSRSMSQLKNMIWVESLGHKSGSEYRFQNWVALPPGSS